MTTRFRRVGLTTASSIAARGISFATSLITVPLTLHYLGAERYGLWATLSSIIALASFADLGLVNGLLNALASAQCAFTSYRRPRPAAGGTISYPRAETRELPRA